MVKHLIIIVLLYCVIHSCSWYQGADSDPSQIQTKADLSLSSDSFTDLNIYIFSENGELFYHRYITGAGPGSTFPIDLWKGHSYAAYAIANIHESVVFDTESAILAAEMQIREGNTTLIPLPSISSGGSINRSATSRVCSSSGDDDTAHHGLRSRDPSGHSVLRSGISPASSGLEDGIPMAGYCTFVATGDGNISIELERLVSKMEISFDFSSLNRGTSITVRSVAVRNAAGRAPLFYPFTATGAGDILSIGDMADGLEISGNGAAAVELYTFENMQGELLPGNTSYSGKTLEGMPEEPFATYIEISADYRSSERSGTIIYRLYPGKNPFTNFDIERNHSYRITVVPTGSGIGTGDIGWRIEDEELAFLVTGIELNATTLFLESVGDQYQMTHTVTPVNADDKSLIWSSEDPSIATVSGQGVITGISPGTTMISAVSSDTGGISASCLVSCYKTYARIMLYIDLYEVRSFGEIVVDNVNPPDYIVSLQSSDPSVVYPYELEENIAMISLDGAGTAYLYVLVHPQAVAPDINDERYLVATYTITVQ